MAVRFRLLGEVAVLVDDRPVDLGHQRQRCVLAVLAMELNRPVPADRLVDRIWGDHPPLRGRNAVYGYVSRLRGVLRPAGATIHREPGGYALRLDESAIDLYLFRHLVARARACDSPDDAVMLFDQALALWQGPAFAELDSPWLASEGIAVDAERQAAELDRTDAALRCGRHTELVPDLVARTARHPLDEHLAGQAMIALYRSGRPADALAHYQVLRTALADQLGIDPSPALQRLHREILTADPGLAAPERPRAIPRQLPPAPVCFAGRAGELTTLDGILADGDTVITVVAGAGGIGKSWLALHWAHTHADHFPDGHLFVDLRGFGPDSDPLDPLTALHGFLDALGVDTARIVGGLAEHSAAYRSHVAGRRMVILLDNAASAEQVIPLLPGTASCTVIVTSRVILTPLVTRHGARHVSLGVLTDTEAHELFAHRVGSERAAAEPDSVAELIRLCGRYPLALGIIASRAHVHPLVPLADFAAELRHAGMSALDDPDPATSLPTVLSWSLRALTAQQRTVLALLAIAPGPDIGLPAAASLTGLPLSEARAMLRTLVAASLVNRQAHDRYAMHDVVRVHAATHHDLDRRTREAALRRVLDFYTHTAHAADRLLYPRRPPIRLEPPAPGTCPQVLPDLAAALAWLHAERSVLMAAQHTAADNAWHRTVWQLAWSVHTYHYRRGHRDDRLAVSQAALDAARHLPEPTARILAHRILGWAQADLGRPDEGIAHLREALTLADTHRDLAQQAHTHRVLAWAWERRGDDRRAGVHAAHARDIFRALGQPTWEADALNLVGWFTARQGRYDSAHAHCHAALTLQRRHHDRGGQAITLDSLGYIAHHVDEHRHALGCYRQALALFHALGNTCRAADTLDSLGRTHLALGEYEQARTVWRAALASYRQQGRTDDTVRIRHQLDAISLA